MKTRSIMLATMFLMHCSLFVSVAKAQRPNSDEMQARRAEMVEKQAEKMAKDFELKGDEKDAFVELYKTYQKDLRGEQRGRGDRANAAQRSEKKLTDEEAKKQIEEYFARQEEQIAQMQRRLDVSKKYYESFQKMLTPQQLAQIFRQQPMREGNMQRGGNFGGPRPGGQRPGGFGGPQGGGFGGGDNNDF